MSKINNDCDSTDFTDVQGVKFSVMYRTHSSSDDTHHMQLQTHVQEPGRRHGGDDIAVIATSLHHDQRPFFDDVTAKTASPGSAPVRIGSQ